MVHESVHTNWITFVYNIIYLEEDASTLAEVPLATSADGAAESKQPTDSTYSHVDTVKLLQQQKEDEEVSLHDRS